MHVTYLRVERRPAPPLPPPPTRARSQIVQPIAQPRVAVQPVHIAPPPRRELAKIDRRALVYQPPRSRVSAPTHATLPQVDYNATIAKLRSAINPVAAARSATQSVQTKHYSANMQAMFGSGGDSEGILTPVNSWSRGGYHWYYVRYYVQYQDGSVETGVVPWPLRYLPSQDPFALDYQHFPLPKPLPDYTPEAGAPMRPLIAFCWEHRSQVASCPIEHD